MQQGDQTMLSLIPGGGRGSRLFGGSSSSSSSFSFGFLSSDLSLFRPHGGAPPSFSLKAGDSRFEGRERVRYTRDQLLHLREQKLREHLHEMELQVIFMAKIFQMFEQSLKKIRPAVSVLRNYSHQSRNW